MAVTAEMLITAIKGTAGNKTRIAERLNVSRYYVYKLLARYPTAKLAYDAEAGRVADAIEDAGLKLALEGNPAMLIYYHKTHPFLRDKFGVEVKKLQIDIRHHKIIEETVKELEAIGEDPAIVFGKLVERAKQKQNVDS
jgi:hypothetical protein